MTDLPGLLLGSSLAVLAVLWWAFCRGLARVSGWQHLSRAYPHQADEEVVRPAAASVRLRRIAYPGGVRLHVGREYLGLSVPRVVAGHGRISIPWGDVSCAAADAGGGVALTFGRAPRTPLHLEAAVASRVDEASGGRLGLGSGAGRVTGT